MKHFLRTLAGWLLCLGIATAQTFPQRPITLICPFPAGGPTDISLRLFAERAAKKLGQPIIVVNRPGVGGAMGPNQMALTAQPDGYTVAQITVNLLRNAMLEKSAPDPINDFTYIIGLADWNTFGLLVKADSPVKSLDQLIEMARKRPGEITFSSVGVGSTNHLLMEQVSARAGVKFLHVPFKGASEARQALLGGHVDFSVDLGWGPQYEAGALRVLATFGQKRHYDKIPTAKEQGLDIVASSPWGLVGPKGMDPKTVQALHDAFRSVIESPDAELSASLYSIGMVPWYRSSKDFVMWARETQVTERALLERLGLLR